MAGRKGAKKSPQKFPKSANAAGNKSTRGFTDDEKAAMKERVQELKGEPAKVYGEGAVLVKIGAMPPQDRALAERLHRIISASAPDLAPRTWYGMPAYSNEDGQVVCFFQSTQTFKARYMTLGFSDKAKLDEGNMWPTSFALKELTAAEETRIAALVKKAVG